MIEQVGSDTVVAVITDSAASCKAAGQLVEAKYPGITWMPCSAHSLALALEDIYKLPWATSI